MLLLMFVLIALLCCACTARVDSNVISLQWAICDERPSTVLAKLGYIPDLHPRKVSDITYYDTSPPKYTYAGLAFRTKEHKHRPISLIKQRFPGETEDVPAEGECVWNRYGNTSWYTCGISAPLHDDWPLWSREQVSFAEHYQRVDWQALVPYGQYVNKKWSIRIAGHKVVFDDVEAIVKGRILHLTEIELKIVNRHLVRDEFYEDLTAYLTSQGVRICEPVQLPKTLRLFDALNNTRDTEEL